MADEIDKDPTAEELAQQAEADTQHLKDRGDFIEEDTEDTEDVDDDQGNEDDETSQEDDEESEKDDDSGKDDDAKDDEEEEADPDAGDQDDEDEDDLGEDDHKEHRVPKSRLDKELRKNRKLQQELDDLKDEAEADDDKGDDEEEADPFDVDAEWDRYQDMIEDGDIDDAKALLREIRIEERKLAKAEVQDAIKESRQQDLDDQLADAALTTSNDLLDRHPEMKEKGNADFDNVKGWANMFEVEQGVPRAEALLMAEEKVFGKPDEQKKEPDPKVDKKSEKKDKGLSQRDIAARQKNQKDSEKQPPRMEAGSSSRGVKTKKPSEMSETEFDNMTDAQKKADRGDNVN